MTLSKGTNNFLKSGRRSRPKEVKGGKLWEDCLAIKWTSKISRIINGFDFYETLEFQGWKGFFERLIGLVYLVFVKQF